MAEELVYQNFFEQNEVLKEFPLQERNLNVTASVPKSRVFSGKKSQQDSKTASIQKLNKSPRQPFDENGSENQRQMAPRDKQQLFEAFLEENERENPRSVVRFQSDTSNLVAENSSLKSIIKTPKLDCTPQNKPVQLEMEVEKEIETVISPTKDTQDEFSYIDVSLPENKLFERLKKALQSQEKTRVDASGSKESIQTEKEALPIISEEEVSSNLMDIEPQVQELNKPSVEGAAEKSISQEENPETKTTKRKVARKREKRRDRPVLRLANESNESPAKEPQTKDKNKRKKYCLAEDIKILQYIEETENKSECMSKNFWKEAVSIDNLLDGTRTWESLRSRYRFFLSELNEEEVTRVNSWGVMYGSPGYLVFNRRLVIDPETKRQTYRNRLESIEFEELKKWKEIPVSTSQSFKPTQWRGFSDNFNENPLNENLSIEQKPPKKPLQNIIQKQDIQEKPQYQEVDNYLGDTKRKIVKKEIEVSESNQGKGVNDSFASKIAWLKEKAEEHQMESSEMMKLYFYCSMNPKLLELYLSGQKDQIWTKEEDELLQEGGEPAIRILSRIKDPHNVRDRSQFLRQYAHIKLLFGL